MLEGRNLLLYLSIKYEGDWDKIYFAIKAKEKISKEEVEEAVSTNKTPFITIIDDEYPDALKNIYKPPFVLFYYGDLSLLDNSNSFLAVVGSRNCYKENCDALNKIISELNNEYIIISGLAIGIDTCAHKSILRNGGKTIAVLGCGIDYIYPKENQDLYQTIKQSNLLISEYPSLTKPNSEHFPIRNRIITGLADQIFVPEVHFKSGTMISISHAISQGKDIMVLPQPIDNGTCNNRLIRDGALLIESGADILDEKK